MRLKYYRLTLRQMGIKKPFAFFLSVLITILILFFAYNQTSPVIVTICEANAKAVALSVTNEAVIKNIQDTKYDSLVDLKQDVNGKVMAINANVMELNRLSTVIASDIKNILQNTDKKYVEIPVTTLLNMGLLSGYGPSVKLVIMPTGGVTSQFKSQFEQAGINQVRHRIFIEVTTKVRLIAPLYTSIQEYVNEITVAETIIVGDTPSTYYNIDGITDLNKNDTLKLLDD